ncbi:MAG TPA: alpha-glucan family phosphorylase [Gaiella sp.]|nr:alpha-glucan family phosphorylase [Gaiella sp.]
MSTTRLVDVASLPGAREADERAAELALRLPLELAPLARIALDYRWAWDPDGSELFRSLDPHAWEINAHNPVRQLADIPPHTASHAAGDRTTRERIARLGRILEEERARPERPIEGLDGPVVFVCAEFGVHRSLPIYSGGLGVLAGDVLKAASDRGVPMIGVGLLYRKGYFQQRVDRTGLQHEYWLQNMPERLPTVQVLGADGAPLRLTFPCFGRHIAFHVWRAEVGRVPLYLLDTELDENDPLDRWITARLYEGNPLTRLGQYGLLGIGTVRALRALGIEPGVLHFNEGHPALAALELAADAVAAGASTDEALAQARERCVFTTHTPVAAGNEAYEPSSFLEAFAELPARLGMDDERFLDLCRARPGTDEWPGMTPLALRLTRRANAVSLRHEQVAREMWRALYGDVPGDEVPITHVTNGVHLPTFLSGPIRALFDRYLGEDWARRAADPATWDALDRIPDEELWAARNAARGELVEYVRTKSVEDRLLRGEDPESVKAVAETFAADTLTLGFARRIATYKRLFLLTYDPERVRRIFADGPPVQMVIAGKAHPLDDNAKHMLVDVFGLSEAIGITNRVAFLENYDLSVAAPIVGGCDVWLNVPRPPLEASGTSGMKSAANGGLNLSVLDGWWYEGYEADETGANGWEIDGSAFEGEEESAQDARHAHALYDLLEQQVIPLFYDRGEDGIPHGWLAMVKRSLRTNGPRFSAARMVEEYAARIYPPTRA